MADPLRVAVILGHWQNYGVETLTLNIYKNIDKDRVQFDFVVCETKDSQMPIEEIESMGGRVYIVPSYSNPIAYQKALKELFERERYAIVHAHMSTLSVFPLRAAKKAGVPIRIVHCHTMYGRGEHLKNAMKYTLRCFSRKYPTHFATSSKYAGKWLYGPKIALSEMYYLPVARDVEAFVFNEERRNVVRKELGLQDSRVVGHLGRFVTQKNHSFLLDVFAEIKKRERAAVLLLAGDGPLVDSVMDKAKKLGIASDVRYLGRRNDVPDLYQAMDVFILPSIYEGVPGTGIEAQASGLPFLYATTVTEEALILDSACRLPLESGAKAWADVAISLMSKERKSTVLEMTKAGYNIRAAANDLQNYYESLLTSVKG